MGIFEEKAKGITLPKMVKIKQIFPQEHIDSKDVQAFVTTKLNTQKFRDTLKPNWRVCITAGSRGIANLDKVISSVVDFVKSCDASPFIIPAMGSHGGATAEGQREILRDYGITEETMGCPIISSMETVHIGDTPDGQHVRIDKNAYEADAVIVVNRVKAHTDFRGPYESGLMKMITIGLGKQEGAESCHKRGFINMAHNVPQFANVTLSKINIVFGLALIENAYDETRDIIPLLGKEIPEKEPELLKLAKSLMPKLFIDETDVLVIDQIGKNISGNGQDPNITGRFVAKVPGLVGGINATQMVVLDLTDETHGNATGLGCADITTKRCIDKADIEKANANCLTSTELRGAALPPYALNDRAAICVALCTCRAVEQDNPRIVRIKNTLQIENIWISEALVPLVQNNSRVVIESGPEDFPFDEYGNLF